MRKVTVTDTFININVTQAEARINKMPRPRGSYAILGKYSIFIDVTAIKDTIYLPVSIGSGRKSTGFIYQMEGVAAINSKATISYKGEGTTIVTSGSISYCKVPAGKTASFKIFAEIESAKPSGYRFVISRINYKFNPNDMRYKRFITEIGTKFLYS